MLHTNMAWASRQDPTSPEEKRFMGVQPRTGNGGKSKARPPITLPQEKLQPSDLKPVNQLNALPQNTQAQSLQDFAEDVASQKHTAEDHSLAFSDGENGKQGTELEEMTPPSSQGQDSNSSPTKQSPRQLSHSSETDPVVPLDSSSDLSHSGEQLTEKTTPKISPQPQGEKAKEKDSSTEEAPDISQLNEPPVSPTSASSLKQLEQLKEVDENSPLFKKDLSANVLPSLIPAWCTESSTENALQSPMEEQNLDESQDETTTLTLVPLTKFEDLLTNFSEGARNNLTTLKQQSLGQGIFDELPEGFYSKLTFLKKRLQSGKISWEQWASLLIGGGIGVGTAYAFGEVFNGGTNYLDKYPQTWPYTPDPDVIFGVAVAFTLLDAIPRNIELWKTWFSTLSSRTAHMGSVALNGGLSFLPSLTTAFALINLELDFYKETHQKIPQKDKEIMLFGAFFLYLDSQAFNMNMLKDIWEDTKEWAETSSSRFARFISGKILYWFPSSPEDKIQTWGQQKMREFKQGVSSLTETQVREVYKKISEAEEKVKQTFPNLTEEEQEAAQALLLLHFPLIFLKTNALPPANDSSILTLEINESDEGENPFKVESSLPLILASQLEDSEKMEGVILHAKPQTWYDTITEWGSRGLLLAGSPMRLMVLKFILGEMGDAIFGQYVSKPVIEIASWGIAALVGFPIQTAFEYKALKNLSHDFVKHEEPNGHSSCMPARITAKAIAGLYGLLLTSAICLLTFQVCDTIIGNDWITYSPEFTWAQYFMIGSIICYLIPEWAVQTTSLEDSYNRKIVSGIMDVHNRYTRRVWWNEDPTLPYQRDALIQFAEKGDESFNHLPSSVLFKLQEMKDGDPYVQKK